MRHIFKSLNKYLIINSLRINALNINENFLKIIETHDLEKIRQIKVIGIKSSLLNILFL